jgi:hypothetical protein
VTSNVLKWRSIRQRFHDKVVFCTARCKKIVSPRQRGSDASPRGEKARTARLLNLIMMLTEAQHQQWLEPLSFLDSEHVQI